MPNPPLRPRITVENLENGIRITIESRAGVLQAIWFGIWFLIWNFLTANIHTAWQQMIIRTELSPDSNASGTFSQFLIPILGIFLVVFLLLSAIAIFAYFWSNTGREIIEVNSQTITISRQLMDRRVSRTYSINLVNDLRVESPSSQILGKILGHVGIVAFTYRVKTVHFGLDIDESEAKQLISVIIQHLPSVEFNS